MKYPKRNRIINRKEVSPKLVKLKISFRLNRLVSSANLFPPAFDALSVSIE